MKAFRATCALLLAVALTASPAFAVSPSGDTLRDEHPPAETASSSSDTLQNESPSAEQNDKPVVNPDSSISEEQSEDALLSPETDAEPNSTSNSLDSATDDADSAPALVPTIATPASTDAEAPSASASAFVFKAPTAGFYSSTAFHYREAGTSSWIAVSRSTAESGLYTFTIPLSALVDGTKYEYVATLLSPASTSNVAGLVYHKVVGTFSHESEGAWTHTNNNGETGIVKQADEDGSSVVTLLKAPRYLAYKARVFAIETNVELGHVNATVTDSLDGTMSDMPNETTRFRKTFYVPASSYEKTASAKTALANAGYPYIADEATDASTNTVNIREFSMPYTVAIDSYKTATGTYHPNGHASTFKLEDTLEADPDSSHSVSVTRRQSSTIFLVDLVQSTPSILVNGLYEGSLVQGKTPEDEALISVSEDLAGTTVKFDVGSETKDVHLELVGSGLFTVPVTFTVDGTNGSIVFKNEAEAAQYVEAISFDKNNKLSVKQLPRLMPEQNGPTIGARSESLFEYIQNTRSFGPGNVTKGEFRISNPRDDVSFKVVDYHVSPDYRPFKKLLRTDSPAIRDCFNRYFPEETFAGKVRHLYDFEGLTGKSLSEALLEMYQERYPEIESLFDLPSKVLAKEVFYDNSRWRFGIERIDLSKGVYEQVGDSYVILETDETMQALANELLYERALSLTFDNAQYPLTSSILSATGELDEASDERLRLLYPSYRDQTDANKAMMDDIISSLPILRPAGSTGDTLSFDNFAFGLNGYLISNPFLKSNYEFSFDFEVILSVVGIEGVAFIDENQNGIRDNGEELLEDVAVTLHGPNGKTRPYLTDEYGRYEIPNVPAGSGYRLTVETPEGLEITSTIAADSLDGNKFLPTGTTDPFEVVDDEAYRYNVGFVPAAPVEHFTLTYHPNGGEGTVVDPIESYEANSEAAVLPHNHAEGASTGFSKGGHEFQSWNVLPDGTGTSYAPGDTIVMDGHKTLYAQWKPSEEPDPEPGNPSDPGQPGDPTPPSDPDNPASPSDPTPLPSNGKQAPVLAVAGDSTPFALAASLIVVAGIALVVFIQSVRKGHRRES